VVLGHRSGRHGQPELPPHPQARFAGLAHKCTGSRSTTDTQMRSGSSRITVAWRNPRNRFQLLRRSLSGTKKMLRPISSPNTGSISARLTWVSPLASMFPAPADAEPGVTAQIAPGCNDTGSQPAQNNQNPQSQKYAARGAGRPHHGPLGSTKRFPPEREESSSSRSSISSGVPGPPKRTRHLEAHPVARAGSGIRRAAHPQNQRPRLSSSLVSHA